MGKCREFCGRLLGLPRKLKVLLILNFVLMILAIALLSLALVAQNYSFPKAAGIESDRKEAQSLQKDAVKWSGGPGIPVLVCALFGLAGSYKRNRIIFGVYLILALLSFCLSAVGFGRPAEQGTWAHFSDSCSCQKENCCDLGALCTDNWHQAAYNCDAPGADRGAACPAGQFRGAPGDECANCTHGTWKGSADSSCCAACPPATPMTLQVGAASSASCTACNADCPAGHQGATSCAPCPANFFKGSAGTGCCKVCPPGTTSIAGSVTCIPPNSCPVGQHQKFDIQTSSFSPLSWGAEAKCKDQHSCVACPAGKYGKIIHHMSYCRECPAGKFQAQPGLLGCEECPAGTFSDNMGFKSCKGCTRGRFSTGAASGCKSCPSGKTSYVLAKSEAECNLPTPTRSLRDADADADAVAGAEQEASSALALALARTPRQAYRLDPHIVRVLSASSNNSNATYANASAPTATPVAGKCANPAGVACCTNGDHERFCDDFLGALNSMIVLNVFNFVALTFAILITVWACRDSEIWDYKQEADEDEDEIDGEEGGESEEENGEVEGEEQEQALAENGKKSGRKMAL